MNVERAAESWLFLIGLGRHVGSWELVTNAQCISTASHQRAACHSSECFFFWERRERVQGAARRRVNSAESATNPHRLHDADAHMRMLRRRHH